MGYCITSVNSWSGHWVYHGVSDWCIHEAARLHIVQTLIKIVLFISLDLEGLTPQPLNLKFENLNATASKKQYDIRDISSILHNLGSF
jgi:hypothetical protein